MQILAGAGVGNYGPLRLKDFYSDFPSQHGVETQSRRGAIVAHPDPMAFEWGAFELISEKTLQISANMGIPVCNANICRVAFCPAV